MTYKVFVCVFAVCLFTAATLCFLSPTASAEEQESYVPDKALSAKMLRFGQQSYQRGKYLDAKEYFRKAIQADPDSAAAWRYYDMATIFGLAENVEKNTSLIAPDVSTRGEKSSGEMVPSAPPPPKAAPAKKTFVIEEDEGC
ncbi:MAG: hypothetical protein JRL30_27065 [Deltaproteobacteria bacterium]|nr:hypothetical protein [Deltaproteobacteria bacterium]